MLFKKNSPDLMKKMRSGKSNQSHETDGPFTGGVLPSLSPGGGFFHPYLTSQVSNGDGQSSVLSRQGSLLPVASSDVNSMRLQLLAANPRRELISQVGNQSSMQSSATVRQLLAQEQRQANALVQQLNLTNSSAADLSMRRQAELLALEELRLAQRQHAAQQAQTRTQLHQLQQAVAPQAPDHTTEDQIRLLLLQRQLNSRNNGCGGTL